MPPTVRERRLDQNPITMLRMRRVMQQLTTLLNEGSLAGDGIAWDGTNFELDLDFCELTEATPDGADLLAYCDVDASPTVTKSVQVTNLFAGGNGIDITGRTVSVDLATSAPGLEFDGGSPNRLRAKVNNLKGIIRETAGIGLKLGSSPALEFQAIGSGLAVLRRGIASGGSGLLQGGPGLYINAGRGTEIRANDKLAVKLTGTAPSALKFDGADSGLLVDPTCTSTTTSVSAGNDTMLILDQSVGANRGITLDNLVTGATSAGAVGSGDEILVYDVSETAPKLRKTTLGAIVGGGLGGYTGGDGIDITGSTISVDEVDNLEYASGQLRVAMGKNATFPAVFGGEIQARNGTGDTFFGSLAAQIDTAGNGGIALNTSAFGAGFPLTYLLEVAGAIKIGGLGGAAAEAGAVRFETLTNLFTGRTNSQWDVLNGIADTDDTGASVSNSTTQTTVYSYTVSAGALASGNAYWIRANGTLSNSSGGNVVYDFFLKFGASAVPWNHSVTVADAEVKNWEVDVILSADGAANAQVLFGTVRVGNGSSATQGTGQFETGNEVAALRGTSSVNTSFSSATFAVDLKMDTAHASASFTHDFGCVRRY